MDALRVAKAAGVATPSDPSPETAESQSPTVPGLELTGEVTTLAGSTRGFLKGQGSGAKFAFPQGAHVNYFGVLFVADTENNRIRRILPDGVVTTPAGTQMGFKEGSYEVAQFATPLAVETLWNGTTYVSDGGNHRIRMVSWKGEVSTLAGSTPGYADGAGDLAKFAWPHGLALAPDGTLYVADSGNHRIRVISKEGTVSTLAGSEQGRADGQAGSARFSWPQGLALGSDGTLYVADSGNHCIRKVSREGTVSTWAGSHQGAADGTGASAQFHSPAGLALHRDGTLYVADAGNHRIRKISRDGVVSTVAGSVRGFADGQGAAAQFSSPCGVALGSNGPLYVTDKDNHRIRVIR
ncbi:MAG: NHL repeat-containing protein [Candidatus Sericytochromatia bacterium]|nr:NHL repeat-containing protein [Candidatus Sericytochromatia bacterium]